MIDMGARINEMKRDGVFIGEAWLRGGEIIIGVPVNYNLSKSHNCDAMGCGLWHVIARFPISAELLKEITR